MRKLLSDATEAASSSLFRHTASGFSDLEVQSNCGSFGGNEGASRLFLELRDTMEGVDRPEGAADRDSEVKAGTVALRVRGWAEAPRAMVEGPEADVSPSSSDEASG